MLQLQCRLELSAYLKHAAITINNIVQLKHIRCKQWTELGSFSTVKYKLLRYSRHTSGGFWLLQRFHGNGQMLLQEQTCGKLDDFETKQRKTQTFWIKPIMQHDILEQNSKQDTYSTIKILAWAKQML